MRSTSHSDGAAGHWLDRSCCDTAEIRMFLQCFTFPCSVPACCCSQEMHQPRVTRCVLLVCMLQLQPVQAAQGADEAVPHAAAAHGHAHTGHAAAGQQWEQWARSHGIIAQWHGANGKLMVVPCQNSHIYHIAASQLVCLSVRCASMLTVEGCLLLDTLYRSRLCSSAQRFSTCQTRLLSHRPCSCCP
jgi:hypothetical protein